MTERQVRAVSSEVEHVLDTHGVAGSNPAPPTMDEYIVAITFDRRIDIRSPSECWPWLGAKHGRYGYGRYKRKPAHRIVYEISRGPIPAGLLVRHSCDNPPCCNPRHLLLGTNKDNTGDAIARNRLAKGERHGKTKLTAEIVAYIRENPLGLAGCDLAVLYSVSEATISYIRSGRSWKKDKVK